MLASPLTRTLLLKQLDQLTGLIERVVRRLVNLERVFIQKGPVWGPVVGAVFIPARYDRMRPLIQQHWGQTPPLQLHLKYKRFPMDTS